MDINKKIDDLAVKYFDGNNVKFASKMNTSETNIRNYRTKTVPKVDFLVKLNELLDISLDWLILDKGSMIQGKDLTEPHQRFLLQGENRKSEVQSIPWYSVGATASLVSVFQGTQNIIDYISIPNMPSCDGALSITGDSMYPLLKSGDIVIYKVVKDMKNSLFFGEMYLLSLDFDGDDMITVKFVQRSDLGDDYIKLVSQNTHHSSKDVHLSMIRAMALVKASVRINTMK